MGRNTRFVLSAERRSDLLALFACLILALLFRLPGLTVFLTADEPRSWFGRSIIFLDSLTRGDWANTGPGGTVPFIENVSLSPAPGVTTMWTGAMGIILEYMRSGVLGGQQDVSGSLSQFLRAIPFDPLDPAMLFSLRLPGVLIAVVAVGLTYWWSRPLLGRWGAFLTAILIALDPFYLALSRVLGHDALVTTFMWLSLLAFLRAIMKGGGMKDEGGKGFILHPSSFILVSGAFAGLAFLSKYPALFIGAFIALVLLIAYLLQTRSAHVAHPASPITAALILWIRDMVLWSVAAGVVFVLFWPAMWVNPLGPLTAIVNDVLRASGSAHQKGSFFLGQPVPDPGALFYPIVALLRTTPVILLGVLVSLWQFFHQLFSHREGKVKSKRREPTPYSLLPTYLWAYILLYTFLVTYGGKKQDRYLLPAFPVLAMLAAMGYVQLSTLKFRFLNPKSKISNLNWLLPLLVLLIQIALLLPYYPYYFSYYNPLAGGGTTAANTIQVGWGEGLNEAAAYLNTLPEAESTKVVSWYSTTFEPYFKGQAIYKIEEEKISRSSKPGLAADYVVFYVNQIQRRLPSEGALAYFQQQDPIYTVALAGQEYAWIYPAPGVAHIINQETRLVGQAELLGFDWLDAEGRRLAAIPSGSVATLRLYWEWQGKAPADPIRISLTDGEGQTWGWANLIDSGEAVITEAEHSLSASQEGIIVVSDYALAVFPGTPPGQYYLNAWIERADTGEVIGQFPLVVGDAAVTMTPPLAPAKPEDFDIRTRLNGSFETLQLLGYNLTNEVWQPGEQRQLELFWAMAAEPAWQQDAVAKLTLLPRSPLPQISNLTGWERVVTPSYPTSYWQSGDHFRDVWSLTLPPHVPRGSYDLQLTVNQIELTLGQVKVGGRERLFDQPHISSLLRAKVGHSIILLGYNLYPPPPVFDSQSLTLNPQSLSLTLFWQATNILAEDYTVFVQLLDADNNIVAQQDSLPQGGAAPTGTWAMGEIVVDEYELLLNSPAKSGKYRLIVGMYHPATLARLPITTDTGETDALTLTTIEVE